MKIRAFKPALSLVLLLGIAPCLAYDISKVSPEDRAFIARYEAAHKPKQKVKSDLMRVGTIDLAGRVCANCKYTLRQGYLSKVISPEDGPWDLSREGFVFLNGKIIQVDPLVKGW